MFLTKGGSSLDAVETAVRILEDSPLFNAGRGSVFSNDEIVEMDASIMDGKAMKAGSVAGVRTPPAPLNDWNDIQLINEGVNLKYHGGNKPEKAHKRSSRYLKNPKLWG